MDGWMDEWMDGWMDGWMGGWIDGDGWIGWIDGWIDRWMWGLTLVPIHSQFPHCVHDSAAPLSVPEKRDIPDVPFFLRYCTRHRWWTQ